MTIFLKEATASQEIPLGYFVDSTDGDTEETALTISNTDIKIWKTGATTLASKNSGGATHISNGVYYATLDATDTNTVGPMVIFVHESGALTVRIDCCVIATEVWDSMIAGTNRLEVDVQEISADTTAATNAESFFDGTGYAGTNNVIPTVTTLTGHTVQTGDNYARLGAPAGASVSADIAVIEGQTDDIGVAGAGLSAVPWNAAWDAEVQSEVNDGLVALGLDHIVSTSVTGTDIADNSIIASLVSKEATADWDDFVNTTDSLQAIRDSMVTAVSVADAVWDEAAADHTSAGSFGELLGDVADDIWDEVLEAAAPANAQTARQLMRIFGSFVGGEYDPTDSGDWNVKALDDSKVRITGTLTAGGKRSNVTLDGS